MQKMERCLQLALSQSGADYTQVPNSCQPISIPCQNSFAPDTLHLSHPYRQEPDGGTAIAGEQLKMLQSGTQKRDSTTATADKRHPPCPGGGVVKKKPGVSTTGFFYSAGDDVIMAS